jgi:hypothetical protein
MLGLVSQLTRKRPVIDQGHTADIANRLLSFELSARRDVTFLNCGRKVRGDCPF